MVDIITFKKTIRKMILQKYKLEFEGDNFDKIVKAMSQSKADEIYRWVESVIDRKINPILVASKKKYKDWSIHELLSFKKDLTIDRTSYRVVFIKVKNSFYIEFHLSDHKYYDRLRKKLYLTKKNY